jgi:hypothetical protein
LSSIAYQGYLLSCQATKQNNFGKTFRQKRFTTRKSYMLYISHTKGTPKRVDGLGVGIKCFALRTVRFPNIITVNAIQIATVSRFENNMLKVEHDFSFQIQSVLVGCI